MELGVNRGECFGRTQLIADHECEEVFLSDTLLEWVESESTRTDKRIQLPPRETYAFPEWILCPVLGTSGPPDVLSTLTSTANSARMLVARAPSRV